MRPTSQRLFSAVPRYDISKRVGAPIEVMGLVEQIYNRARRRYGDDAGSSHPARLLQDELQESECAACLLAISLFWCRCLPLFCTLSLPTGRSALRLYPPDQRHVKASAWRASKTGGTEWRRWASRAMLTMGGAGRPGSGWCMSSSSRAPGYETANRSSWPAGLSPRLPVPVELAAGEVLG